MRVAEVGDAGTSCEGQEPCGNGRVQTGAWVGRIFTSRRCGGSAGFIRGRLGCCRKNFLGTDFSLTEGRVLYELAHKRESTAAAVGAALALDAGYLSRILSSFEKKRLIVKTPSPTDRRQSILTLTALGRKAFAPLEARSSEQVGKMIATLPESKKRRLVDAMQTVENLLGARWRRS